jgi:hypothetical protein
LETTPGTPVAANKRLTSLGIEPSISVEIDQFRPAGQKYKSFTTLGKEYTTANLSGRATYTEIVYPLASIVGNQAITTPAGATLARNWNFRSNPINDDVVKTFTIDHGSSVRADRFSYALVTELGFNVSRQSAEITGSLMGKAITDGVTMTASPTVIDLVPCLPTQASVYLDDSFAALGTTKLDRALSVDWSLGSRFSPVWPLDAANGSTYAAIIESEPDLTVSLSLEANADGMAILETLREGETKYLRIEFVGAEIEEDFNYKVTIDTCVEVVDSGGFQDSEGVYTIDWSFVGVVDGAWGTSPGKAFDINVVNAQTAL